MSREASCVGLRDKSALGTCGGGGRAAAPVLELHEVEGVGC